MKYAVYVTYRQTAYVEVEAKDENEAEFKGFALIEAGEGESYGSDDNYDIEVEEL